MHLSSRVSFRRRLALALAALLAAGAAHADSYTYSGRLDEFGAPVTGRYDLRLAVHADAIHGSTGVAPITFHDVKVVDGAFRVDFDLPPGHDQAWVELSIRPTGSVDWVALPGRTKALNAPAAIGQCWSTTGDSGSNPATNFIGTTDAEAFTVRTANAPSLRIEPSSETFGSPALPITTNTIGGSHANTVTSGVRGATIAGGGVPTGASDPDFGLEAPNQVTDHYGTVGGGYGNQVGDAAGSVSDAVFATVGGGYNNTASGNSSTVGGGALNAANGDDSTVGGGLSNTASGTRSTVGGGFANTASGNSSTVGGGADITASGSASTVGGGNLNTASGSLSTVGGGLGNTTSGSLSTVGGGERNTASGFSSTVGGGVENCAGGDYSWAGGNRAKARPGASPGSGACAALPSYPGGTGDAGTFVWADSQSPNFVSTGDNQFLVRAGGGIYLGTTGPVILPDGRFINTSTGAHLTSGGTWTNASSRALKTAFESIDAGDVLARLLALPLTRWQYRDSPAEGVHLGPVAEEFHAAFGLGADGRAISTVDASGVALAAIQGLNAKLESENAALRAESAELRAELERRDAEYRSRLDRLEALLVERASASR